MNLRLDRSWWVAAASFLATEVQLIVATFGGLDRFEGKGFSYRLVVNTVLMLAAPTVWRVLQRGQPQRRPVPWWPCAIIISSFLWDALGNSLGLYDSWDPFDNVSHVVTWFLLLWGVGLFIARAEVRPPWVLVALITGLGATIAVVWEIGGRHPERRGPRQCRRILRWVARVSHPSQKVDRSWPRRPDGVSRRARQARGLNARPADCARLRNATGSGRSADRSASGTASRSAVDD